LRYDRYRLAANIKKGVADGLISRHDRWRSMTITELLKTAILFWMDTAERPVK
jgi:hypothetical protein